MPAPGDDYPQVHYVHPHNWRAFEVFDACHTQWRVIAGAAGCAYQGLDYAALGAVMDLMGIKRRKRVFQQVRLIEAGALSVLSEQVNG